MLNNTLSTLPVPEIDLSMTWKVTESCNNSVSYGHRGSSEPASVDLTCEFENS